MGQGHIEQSRLSGKYCAKDHAFVSQSLSGVSYVITKAWFQVEGLEVVWKEPKVVASPLVFEATQEEIFAEMEASNRD